MILFIKLIMLFIGIFGFFVFYTDSAHAFEASIFPLNYTTLSVYVCGVPGINVVG